MGKDEYTSDRTAIHGYASDVWAEVSSWNESANRLKGAKLDPLVFTAAGGRVAAAYNKLVAEYAWYAWRIGITFDRVDKTLGKTAENYGKAESTSKNSINKIGEQF